MLYKNIFLIPKLHLYSRRRELWNKCYLLILLSLLYTNGCKHSKSVKGPDPSKYEYFRITANSDDDPIFVKLQDDLGIQPKMEVYTIVVNVKSTNPAQQYILWGDVDSYSAKYPWSRVSKEVQTGLLKWRGSNKENLE